MKLPILYLASLAPLVAAHFELKYPTSRDGSEEQMTQFPCGGAAQSSNRTQVSISAGSFPVALSMGHSQTAVEVLLALGSDPGTNYNITLHQTFEIQGLGAFCLPHIKFDESILGTNITDGMNATVQVQSNGDPTGGLYACADIQFSSTVSYEEPSSCSNNTGVTAVAFTGAAAERNANESTASGEAQSSSSSSTSSGSSSTSTSTGGAVALETAAWGMLGAAVVGGMALL
ncbi:putative GPI anchored protein [Aspergillus luchuensis]|uniref:GPI anchored protein n=2 Tax=Aspergillus kawachii TaxID=1069201 RepID=A0A146EYY5_ASPKA|nr:uncharacterized protein AKAW2_61138S [Aspergillus luchuensis]OJZ85283.1 hypothetical protein ASPFODRAFT_47821 [Aspergillus luchuensis CBS 106.47]GAA87665.1 GPI anchored protein [Aspergillus luchuensis IFO 4308]BCS02874.1 hypothetical protein AKAW2_61138S [Aspergillus luchuensis]BCS14525.1 hypothetical protein ALUC_61081S [Aspergillus luchuensis]GAT18781.1 GPI anchored protein [Aspergillus luchuensis]